MRGNKLLKTIDFGVGVPLLGLVGMWQSIRTRGRFVASAPLRPGDGVLVVKQSALGDTLLLLPVLKALKDRVGAGGRVVMVVTPVNRTVVEACPWVDEMVLLDPGRDASRPTALLGLIRRLRREGFAFALDFDQWLRSSALLTAASGARTKVGFRTPGQHRHGGYDAVVDQEPGHHEADLFARLAGSAGAAPGDIEGYPGFLRRHGIWCQASAVRPAVQDPPRVVFHPGCGSHGRRREWPLGNYAELGAKLHAERRAEILLTGHGEHEEALADEFEKIVGFPVENLAGRVDFGQLAARLARCDLLVCGNTGVMHLAAGLGTPLVALHGPTDPAKWGPCYGLPAEDCPSTSVLQADLPCAPCLFLGFEYGCRERPCMESLGVSTVLDRCLALLG